MQHKTRSKKRYTLYKAWYAVTSPGFVAWQVASGQACPLGEEWYGLRFKRVRLAGTIVMDMLAAMRNVPHTQHKKYGWGYSNNTNLYTRLRMAWWYQVEGMVDGYL